MEEEEEKEGGSGIPVEEGTDVLNVRAKFL